MKKLSTFAAAAALAVAAALPATAQQADPFVSTQGLGANISPEVVAGIAAVVIVGAAFASSDSDGDTE
mgnify:CR=1 FL=1